MTIATTVASMQALNATVTGIASAPTTTPASINTANLPLAITVPGPATWRYYRMGNYQHERQYLVRVFVSPVGQDTVDEAFDAIAPILQAMAVAYMANPTLTNTVYNVEVADSGLDGQLMFGGHAYRGFELRVTVTEDL